MKITEKQIATIADDLDCGMRCLYNLKTGEIKLLPNFEQSLVVDEELWFEDTKEVEDNWSDYFEFKGFESYQSFQIMEDFAESVDNTVLQNKLIHALNRPKPFRNFKWEVDNSGKYRQQWFGFKKDRYIEWVKQQIYLNKEYFSE